MKKIAILVATGFEDVELIGAIDHWKRAGIEFDIFSIEDKDFVEGSFFAGVNTKRYNLEEILSYGALFIPGGKAKKIFDRFKDTKKIITEFNDNNKSIFAICAAPDLLYKSGILKGKTFTCWPGLGLNDSSGEEVEECQNVVTGRDYLSTMHFAEIVVKHLKKLGW